MINKAKRIVFIANTRLEHTPILSSMLLSLIEMGYYVKDIDITQNPGITINPKMYMGGHGPVEVNYSRIKNKIEAFKPDMIIFAGGGLTFSEEVTNDLKKKGIIILGITLSDPDVFCTVKNYVNRFSYHTTNSTEAYKQYHSLGITNTHYLPFGIDSRFFVPTKGSPEFECDVLIIGHFRPERLSLANQLREKFNTKIFGRNWPYDDAKSIDFPEWLRVVHSGKIIVDFPKTGAGFNNVKVRLFEVTATGKLIITEKLDKISEFFEYGSEIVGYENLDELYSKIEYYLANATEREKIGRNAQTRCAQEHMWKNRFESIFNQIGFI